MLLEAKKLDKSFNGVYALKGLDLSLKEGEIHGLVGENGAGKSTFIKILGGVYTKNGGELSWNGAPFPADFGPVESRELGINIIFQDHVLIPAFSALENIWLGRPYPRKGGLIQWKEMEKAAQKKGEELGIHLDLKKSIFQMTPAQKKCVEILRAMMSDCKLMILDEPTASLSDKETNLLFSIIRNLKAKGTAVLYVTHRLEEIMALTDRVTVLRNGELVSTCDTASTSQKELVRLMVERFTAAADQNAEIGADQIDQIAVFAGLHRVRHGVGAHVLQQPLDELLDLFFHRTWLRRGILLRLHRRGGLRFAGGAILLRAVVSPLGARGAVLPGLALRARLLRGGRSDDARLLLLRGGGRDHARGVGALRGGRSFFPGLGARRAGQRGLRLLIGDFIADLDLGRLRADAEEAGLRVFQHLHRDGIAIHAQLVERGLNGDASWTARF